MSWLFLILWLGCGVLAVTTFVKKGYGGCLLWLLFGWNLVPLIVALGPISWLIAATAPQNYN
jgi:hypothetical protein